jgi:glucose-6-phosphate isomerase
MPDWEQFQKAYLRYSNCGISIDFSRMGVSEDFFEQHAEVIESAFADMRALEAGEIANPDEQRMVGHYWLRDASLAPTSALREEILAGIADAKELAGRVHGGELLAPNGQRFRHLLLIGIGGSALGPQLVADCLGGPESPMSLHFFDNTDPDGFDRVLAAIGKGLIETLVLVVSKSGGTKETRNGMLEAELAFSRAGLDFSKHAVAVTGVGSHLDLHAEKQGWLERFPMADWIGGRTSVMSSVGLIPAALQGVDIDQFLDGAAALDTLTREMQASENIAMILALMWHHAGGGRGTRDMVVLPYKDRLVLLSKYLQQLVMESLGKERDLDGNAVHQGLAVYGNKGSTDQHAYVQQLRDGIDNFFAVFIEVRKGRDGDPGEVEPGFSSGDYLQGFLRGTRSALSGSGRLSMTISVPRIDAFYLGALIAIFERAVSFYASLVRINAYHQPGVEAGKKAATSFLDLLSRVRGALATGGAGKTAGEIAGELAADPEEVFHCLNHIAANDASVALELGVSPAQDRFTRAER